MEKMVSVVIPVYRARNYIACCVDSIINQTYKNIEVILVDDGSDDGSGILCDVYAERYQNIFCIHQENKGVSHARNIGIDHARGEYILFVDSDDYISPDYLEKACMAFRTKDVDMYLCGYRNIEKNGKRKGERYYPLINETVWRCNEMGAVMLNLFNSTTLHAIGTKIYKKGIIEKYKIRFKEKWKHYEDIYFCLTYLKHCDNIYVQNMDMYFYRRDADDSLSKQQKNYKYVGICRTYCLLCQLAGFSLLEEEEKRAFGKRYLREINKCINAKILTEKRYTINIRRLYQKISKDMLYMNALAEEGSMAKKEYFLIKNRLYFGAFLIRCYDTKYIEA